MLALWFKVTIISLSGALAPGPLTTATATWGLKKGAKGGILVSIGHTIIELPYVILISLGVLTVFKNPKANLFLGILGSLFLLFLGFSTIKEGLKGNLKLEDLLPRKRGKANSPLLTGIFLTAFNPYFFAWWIGVGAPLISEAMAKAGFFGVGVLYLFHVWLDYLWLILVAAVASFGQIKIGVYRSIMLFLGGLLIWFGLNLFFKTIG